MEDVFEVLDCALRSRFMTPESMPTLPIWKRLPVELRVALGDAIARGEELRTVVPLIWKIRAELLGKPEPDDTGERTQRLVNLQLGLLFLSEQNGRLDAVEMLTKAIRLADSHVCGVDPRPFSQLRDEFLAGRPDEGKLQALFAPYSVLTSTCVERWGLNQKLQPI